MEVHPVGVLTFLLSDYLCLCSLLSDTLLQLSHLLNVSGVVGKFINNLFLFCISEAAYLGLLLHTWLLMTKAVHLYKDRNIHTYSRSQIYEAAHKQAWPDITVHVTKILSGEI